MFEDIVDKVPDAAGRPVSGTYDSADVQNEVRFYADFREAAAELACIPFAEIRFPKAGGIGVVVVCHNGGFRVVKQYDCFSIATWFDNFKRTYD